MALLAAAIFLPFVLIGGVFVLAFGAFFGAFVWPDRLLVDSALGSSAGLVLAHDDTWRIIDTPQH
jgi:hypothetical protein